MPPYKETANQTLLTTQIHLHTTQIQRDERNKQNTSSITARKVIQKRSKPSINKISEHNSSMYYHPWYYGNHLFFFNVFYLILFLNFRLFISFFSQIFAATQIKSSKVYFIFLISVFAIFSINNLNVCHRNFDVNRNHHNCTTFRN